MRTRVEGDTDLDLRDKAIGAWVGYRVGLDISGPMYRLGALLERLDPAEVEEAMERERGRLSEWIAAHPASRPSELPSYAFTDLEPGEADRLRDDLP